MSRSNSIKNSKEYHCPFCNSTVHISPRIAKPLIPVACGNCCKDNKVPIYQLHKDTNKIEGSVEYIDIKSLRNYENEIYLNEQAIYRLENNELIPLGYHMKGSKNFDKLISKIKDIFK